MYLVLVGIAFLAGALGQSWNLGQGTPPGFLPDPCTVGSIVWPAANAAAIATYTGEYQTSRWGASFSCLIPANGPGTLTFETIEPTVAGPGLRIFTLTINGVTQPPIDIFALCGANTPCPQTYRLTAGGILTIACSASVRNCLGSALKWIPDSLLPPPSFLCIAPVVCTYDTPMNQWRIELAPTGATMPCAIVEANTLDSGWHGMVQVADVAEWRLSCLPQPSTIVALRDTGSVVGVLVPWPPTTAQLLIQGQPATIAQAFCCVTFTIR